MSYREWFVKHANKQREIVQKLVTNGLNKEQIIDYFDFDNMVKEEPDFCYLYADKKKCHDIANLNCYLCACPLFRFKDAGIYEIDGKNVYSYCSVDSKYGRHGVYGEKIHQDCSKCSVPHGKKYISKNYDENWLKIMKNC